MAKTPKSVETITHEGDTNIPTAEYENLMRDEDKKPLNEISTQPRFRPATGLARQGRSRLVRRVVTAPLLYIQEKLTRNILLMT